ILAIAEILSSAAVVHFTISGFPAATPHRTLASGPTCAGFSSNRGALTHEYLPFSWKSVNSGSVSPFHGCRPPAPLYQECALSSVTPLIQNGSFCPLIGVYLERSPPGM